jgi:signal transduction histidine kinase
MQENQCLGRKTATKPGCPSSFYIRVIKSPTIRLLIGLLVTLAAVMGFSWYALYQLRGLQKLQAQTIDANRHDSLLLLRVQNDLNMVGLKLRDMAERTQASPIASYRSEFEALREDLEQAIQAEGKLSPGTRRPRQQAELINSVKQFWQLADQVFAEAGRGQEAAARALVVSQLSPQQSALAARVSGLLERNNEAEERADMKVATIYEGVEDDIYAFLAATMIAIAATSLYLIYSNRRIFQQIESLSRQRRVLAARLITIQEKVLRSVSRELHDEFGQILTAVGAMLARAERKGLPPDSPFRTELSEVREITHNTLEKMRSLSQMLHPAVIDDYGLAKGIEWYTEVFERQTGIPTTATVMGTPVRITGQPAIHTFRIVQEALNNAAKHSGTGRAEVEMVFGAASLTVKVRDFGCGMPQAKKASKPGLGLIAMRERAELMGAKLEISSVPNAGTTVSIVLPLGREDHGTEVLEDESLEEVVSRT